MMKPVRLTKHAEEQMGYRGAVKKEVVETIQTGGWLQADLGKLETKKDFPFNNIWNGKFYKVKQVRPIFVEEESEIVVVTVYVYYF